MNERIKELAKQAFIQERLGADPTWKESKFSDMLLRDFEQMHEIFARLIIEESCLMLQGFTFEWVAAKAIRNTFGD